MMCYRGVFEDQDATFFRDWVAMLDVIGDYIEKQ